MGMLCLDTSSAHTAKVPKKFCERSAAYSAVRPRLAHRLAKFLAVCSLDWYSAKCLLRTNRRWNCRLC